MKLKSLFLSLLLIATGSTGMVLTSEPLHATQSDNKTTVSLKMTVTPFQAVKAASGLRIVGMASAEGDTDVTLRAPKTATDKIEVKVENGVLRIGVRKGQKLTERERSRTVVCVAAPSVNRWSAEAAARIEFPSGYAVSGKLNLEARSAGTICWQAPMTASKGMSLTAHSGSEVSGLGLETDSLEIDTESGGDLHLKAINCQRLSAKADKGGSVLLDGKCATTAWLYAFSGGSVDAFALSAERIKSYVARGGEVEAPRDGHTKVERTNE
ncbi:MAG: GIN domain-containing protein [Alloprevotella sp.]